MQLKKGLKVCTIITIRGNNIECLDRQVEIWQLIFQVGPYALLQQSHELQNSHRMKLVHDMPFIVTQRNFILAKCY